MSNEKLYARTSQTFLFALLQSKRLLWFGQIARMTPAILPHENSFLGSTRKQIEDLVVNERMTRRDIVTKGLCNNYPEGGLGNGSNKAQN